MSNQAMNQNQTSSNYLMLPVVFITILSICFLCFSETAQASGKQAAKNTSTTVKTSVKFNFSNVSIKVLLSILEDYSKEKIHIAEGVDLEQKVFIIIDEPWTVVLEEIGNEIGFSVRKKGNETWIYPSKDISKRTGLVTNKDNLYYSSKSSYAVSKKVEDGRLINTGTIHYGNGMAYTGELTNGKAHGFGLFQLEGGKPYLEGTWKDGKLNGIGRRYNTSSELKYFYEYTGEFKDNEFNGYGRRLTSLLSENDLMEFSLFEGAFKPGFKETIGFETVFFVPIKDISANSTMISLLKRSTLRGATRLVTVDEENSHITYPINY